MSKQDSQQKKGQHGKQGKGYKNEKYHKVVKEEAKATTKVASPGSFLLQFRTDGSATTTAHDVTLWRKRISVLALKECPNIGRCIEELTYREPEPVARPNFAAIEDEDDKYVARQMYMKALEQNLQIQRECEKEKPKLYGILESKQHI